MLLTMMKHVIEECLTLLIDNVSCSVSAHFCVMSLGGLRQVVNDV